MAGRLSKAAFFGRTAATTWLSRAVSWAGSRARRSDLSFRVVRRARAIVSIAALVAGAAGIFPPGLARAADSDRPITEPGRPSERGAAEAGRSTEEPRPPLNRDPILIKNVPTEYPEEFVGSGLNAEVVVTMLVDRMGRASHIRVEGSPDPAFTDAALEALGQFVFLPAIKNGRITNAPLQMTLQVREDLGDRAYVDYEGGRIELLATNNTVKVDTPIKRLFGPRPAYPIEMLAADKSGEVVVEFVVGDDGRPRDVRVVESTFTEFAHAVRGSISLWKYSPALVGARPVPTGLRYRISFEAGEVPEATRVLAKQFLAGDNSGVVVAKELDTPPRVRSQIQPVPPVAGPDERKRVHRADVVFMVDAKGVVRLPRYLKASDPVAGYAALAAVNYWTFDPALRRKEPVPVLVTLPFRF